MPILGGALILAVAFSGGWLALRALGDALGSPSTSPSQRVPFLGGMALETHAWSRYHARYYAMALLFLAFDMEMVFMYPWAVVFVQEGMKALVEMLMFILILTLGILYAWREKALRWA